MKRVAEMMGNSDTSLDPPATWEKMDDRALPVYEVQKGSAEFNQAETFFLHTLKNHHYYSKVKVSPGFLWCPVYRSSNCLWYTGPQD